MPPLCHDTYQAQGSRHMENPPCRCSVAGAGLGHQCPLRCGLCSTPPPCPERLWFTPLSTCSERLCVPYRNKSNNDSHFRSTFQVRPHHTLSPGPATIRWQRCHCRPSLCSEDTQGPGEAQAPQPMGTKGRLQIQVSPTRPRACPLCHPRGSEGRIQLQ